MNQDAKKNEFDPRWVRIIETTRKLFLRYGYTHTSIKAIADEAHVSKATVYSYWTAKEELFNSLILWESLHTFDDWLQRVESDPMGGTVGHMFAHGIAAVSANAVLYALYSRDSQTLGELLRERGKQLTTQRYGMGLDFVSALQAAHLVRTDLPADHINHILTAISVGLISVGELYNPASFPEFAALATSLGEMFQAALAPPGVTGDSESKSIIMKYLIQQRQATLEALLSLSQALEGDR